MSDGIGRTMAWLVSLVALEITVHIMLAGPGHGPVAPWRDLEGTIVMACLWTLAVMAWIHRKDW